nr:RHS repeat-associated core domain-containing protein [Thiorhodococcus minor]
MAFDYDGALTIDTQWSGTVNGQVETDWNSDFAIAAHIINDSHSISYDYDGDGLLTQAGALILARDPDHGLLTGTSLGGLTTSQDYNAFGELEGFSAQQDGSALYGVTYSRDRLGRIRTKTETLQGETSVYAYDYDLAGRLTAVRENGVLTGSWDYDANGNRIGVDGTANGTYDEQDRLLQYDAPARPRPSGTIGYVIDGQDRRIGKTRDGELVQGFLYKDQLNPIAELDGEGNLVAVFVYGEQANVPAYLIKIDPETQEETTYRILSDHLGSPRLVVEVESGAVVQRMDYDAWGVVTRDTQPGFQPFGFAGGLYEPETGLVRFGARDYDPYTGRWLGKDPIGFDGDGPNLYNYALSDPVNLIDISGYSTLDCLGLDGDYFLACIIENQMPAPQDITPCIKCKGDYDKFYECLVGSGPALTSDCGACILSRGNVKKACISCAVGAGTASACFMDYCRLVPASECQEDIELECD